MSPLCDLAALSGVCPEKLANDLEPASVTFQWRNVWEHAKIYMCMCNVCGQETQRKGKTERQNKRGKNRGTEN